MADAVARSHTNGTNNPDGSAKLRKRGMLRLKRKAVAFYAAQIICALDVLHAQRIVYRSLTPASLLLDSNGQMQLGSFGLAKQLGT